MTWVLIVAVSGLAAALAGKIISRGAGRGDGSDAMRYPAGYAWLGAVSAGFFLLLAAAAGTGVAAPAPAMPGVFLAFAALGLLFALDARLTRHRIGDEGLHHRWAFRGPALLPWDEIEEVAHSPLMKWWVLRTPDGARRVSLAMSNQPRFAEAVLARVPPRAIGDGVRPLLTGAAAGDPPPAF